MSTHRPPQNFGTPSGRVRWAGVTAIMLLSGSLALATASECSSITHLPSLIYGLVLWGWWGCKSRPACELIGSYRSSSLRFFS